MIRGLLEYYRIPVIILVVRYLCQVIYAKITAHIGDSIGPVESDSINTQDGEAMMWGKLVVFLRWVSISKTIVIYFRHS